MEVGAGIWGSSRMLSILRKLGQESGELLLSHSQSEIKDECSCSASFFLFIPFRTQAQRIVPLFFRVDLPTSANVIKVTAHRHAPKLAY